jgi:cation:H+ antiporter
MEIALNISWIILGLAGLYYGAEWLVRGAAGIALMAGISALVVGLTIVAFGTSMPELLVSVQANLNGDGDFALGNVIGSNICNIGLVLGVAAAMTPIVVHVQFIRRELPMLVIVSLMFVAMLLVDQQIDRIEGLIFTIGILIYSAACIVIAKRNPEDPIAAIEDELESELPDDAATPSSQLLKNAILIILGLIILGLGANRLIAGGKFLAVTLGVSDAVISLTLVAFGTSLPELATTIVACLKNESDLAAGNAIGSCLFNLLCVAGVTALIKPINLVSIETMDLAVMVAFSVATFLLMRNGRTLGRQSGYVLLVGYLAYIILLIVREMSK